MKQPDFKTLSRGMSRDMSSAAIARRLEIASDLRDLATALATARRIDRDQPDEAPFVRATEARIQRANSMDG